MDNINKFNRNILSFSLMLIPLWWILGIKFFIFQVTSLYFLISNFNKDYKLDIDIKRIMIFICLYIISTIIAIINNPLDVTGVDRLTPLYLISYWIMGIFIILGFQYKDQIEDKFLLNIFKATYILGIFSIILLILGIITWHIRGPYLIENNGLFFNILPNNIKFGIFDKLTKLDYMYIDWINGIKTYRYNGFYVYPVAAAMGTVYILIYSLVYLNCNKELLKSKKKIYYIIYFIMLGSIVYFAKSRMVIIGSIISIIITSFIYIINKDNYKKVLIYTTLLIFILSIISINFGLIEKVLEMRASSNSDRLFVYEKAINTFLKHPIFGVGVRYFIEESIIPVGSHSTYIGALMRSGIIGFIGILLFVLNTFISIYNNKKYIINNKSKVIWIATSFLFILSSLWMITEDIDWPHIVAFFYFINTSIIYQFKRIKYN